MSAKMLLQDKLMNEIVVVTTTIREKHPELYEHLSETPLFLFYNRKGNIIVDFEQYLESLAMQLAEFEEPHHA